MYVGIVRFPGSNCDFDTLRWFRMHGHSAEFVWHKDQKMRAWDILVLPGGFAIGDRRYERATGAFTIDPGAQALNSPVMDAVRAYANAGRPVLGICNGFQILVHAGLLPGALAQNVSGLFFCGSVPCRVEGSSFFRSPKLFGNTFSIPVAHGYGRYVVDDSLYQTLLSRGQIFLRYAGGNPNGSCHDIAGVSNEAGTTFGMMPHPERMRDSRPFMEALEDYVKRNA